MQIGINCFEDVELRSIILSIGIKGTCDLTGEEDVFVYDTNDVSEDYDLSTYLSEVLDVYTPQSELLPDFPTDNLEFIEDILEKDWSIFNLDKEKIKTVIKEICKNVYEEDSLIYKEKVGIDKLCDSNYLKRNGLMRESSWEKFTYSIKSMNRFHSGHVNLELLKQLFESPGMQKVIKKGESEYFRARISDQSGLKPENMGAPPIHLTSAGRANSQGIRCLYLASDLETTIHEIRARDLDYVSVGKFKATKDLKIVDLANLDKISPFNIGVFDIEWFAINMAILKKISKEIAKPLRRQDSDLDYLPSQYIADYIKSLGYDGISYRSTLHKEGVNYAIFDPKKFECSSVQLVYIDSLQYVIEEK